MYDFLAIAYGIVSMFTGFFMLSQTLNFHKYWIGRTKEYKQASTYMQSENCQNPLMRAHLGSFNKCEDAEEILGRYPVITALHDVATDLNICGHGRCHIFYMDITNNLHKIVLGSILLSMLGVWIFKRTCAERKHNRDMEYYTLPTKKRD